SPTRLLKRVASDERSGHRALLESASGTTHLKATEKSRAYLMRRRRRVRRGWRRRRCQGRRAWRGSARGGGPCPRRPAACPPGRGGRSGRLPPPAGAWRATREGWWSVQVCPCRYCPFWGDSVNRGSGPRVATETLPPISDFALGVPPGQAVG